jgi:type IV pilus assembly protein PilC
LRLGETSGQLETVMRELAGTLERSAEVALKFRSALTMPLIQAVGSLVLLVLMVSTLLPGMLDLSKSVGAELGPTLKACFWLASTALDPLVLFAEVQVALALGFALRRWALTSTGRRALDGLVLKLPIARNLALDYAAFRFSQGMGGLLGCGCTMVAALRSVAETMANSVLRSEIHAVADRVTQGDSLTLALVSESRLNPLLISVVAVGEETGALHRLLQQMSHYYQQEIEDRLDAMVVLLEPLILGLLGAVVAFLSLLFFLPIMKVVQSL